MVSPSRVARMARKEVRQMLRDFRMRGVIFVAPLIQLVVLGYAVSTDVRRVPTFVVDQDRTAASRELVDRITASEYFRVVGYGTRGEGAVAALERGVALVALEIPPGFAADLQSGGGTAVQVLVDGTDSNTGSVALGYLQRILRGMQPSGPDVGGVHLASRAWFNPALESRVYNVPAVIGALLLLITMLLTSLSVVREREIGTWDQLVVSPITPAELMLGKTLPVVAIGLIDLVLVSGVAILWFDIPLRGSPLSLAAGAVPFLTAGLALGLIISTVSTTQQEAFMSMFLVLLPSLILSGFMFPIASMPVPFRLLTLANPLRHFLEVVRGVFLKGAGFAELWAEYATLYGMAIVGLGIAVRRFTGLVGTD